MEQKGNMLLVANWESNVGYAWWLMESFWITIANQLETQGIKSVLIYPKITNIPPDISNSNINVEEINIRNKSLNGLKKLHRTIKNNNIRYIYLTDSPSYSWLYCLLRLWGIKKIIIHDHTPGERTKPNGIKRWIKILIQKIPYYTADKFIAVTEYVQKRLTDISCIPKHKCACATNGIIPFNLNKIDSLYTQKEFGIPENKIIVVSTGRATYYKGIDFIIECADTIINKLNRKDFHFLYCGDGPNIHDFKTLVTKYQLDNDFTFSGKRDDVRKILPSCHIGFHAALGEVGYSLSILEYMSAGLICIIPDNPSTSLATTHKKTGYLYDRNSIESAVDALIEASTPNNQNYTIAKNANQLINKDFDISRTHNKLIRIINRTIC